MARTRIGLLVLGLGGMSLLASCRFIADANALGGPEPAPLPTAPGPAGLRSTIGSQLDLAAGKSQALAGDVSYNGAIGIALIWNTGSPAVATVDPQGNLTAIAPGTAIVTANLLADPSTSVQFTVVVTPGVTSLAITPRTLQLYVGGATQLQATVTYSDGTEDSAVLWASNNNAVAQVNPTTGMVTALGTGTATITGSSRRDPTVSSGAVVTVSASTPVSLQSLGEGQLLRAERRGHV